jgi:hypothetical protein
MGGVASFILVNDGSTFGRAINMYLDADYNRNILGEINI